MSRPSCCPCTTGPLPSPTPAPVLLPGEAARGAARSGWGRSPAAAPTPPLLLLCAASPEEHTHTHRQTGAMQVGGKGSQQVGGRGQERTRTLCHRWGPSGAGAVSQGIVLAGTHIGVSGGVNQRRRGGGGRMHVASPSTPTHVRGVNTPAHKDRDPNPLLSCMLSTLSLSSTPPAPPATPAHLGGQEVGAYGRWQQVAPHIQPGQ